MASRILLADDSITIQKVVNLTFADEGIEVVAVSNGDLAERRLSEVQPDLVLADIFMPGKNGYELCEAIKENAQFKNVPVVLLVGAFEPFDQAEARRVRADAHLTKPFESRTLVETVRRLISASWRTTTGPIAPTPAAENRNDDASATRDAGATAAPNASQLAGKIDLSAMVAATVQPSPVQVRNTGELGSPSPVARPEVFDLGVVNTSVPEVLSTVLTDTSERFEPLESSANGGFSPVEIAPSFDIDTGNFQTDDAIDSFDTPELGDIFAPPDPISLETGPNAVLEVNTSDAGGGEHWFNSGSVESSTAGGLGWQAPANGSPLSYQSPDFALQTETGYSASESATETACATLLAVDEPLGDVLFDEGVSVRSLAPLEIPSSDSLGLEFSEPESAPVELAVSTQFDLVEIYEAPPEASFEVVENGGVAAQIVVEAPVVEEPVVASTVNPVEATQPMDKPEYVESIEPTDPQLASGAVEELDWTAPHPVAHSTAQLDSVVTPIETAEYFSENAAGENVEQPEIAEEASFTAPAMWTEEEARFTPIDIEGVAVDEALSEETSQPAVTLAAEPIAADIQAAVDTLGSHTAGQPVNGSPSQSFSPAAIEEIVRRVVAEMSESVVREVAWEVVPDCVERVIEQLTRESLAKRV